MTTIGVKQGGSLSPRLFSLYMEEIIDSSKYRLVKTEKNDHKYFIVC